MSGRRFLIVNADDFGQSPGINRGVIQAHEQGIVTSASLMVRWPAAVGAAAYARDHPTFSVGLHLDLGEWAFQASDGVPRYQVVPTADTPAIAGEVERQLAEFRRLVGRDPTHVDSHQHVHLREPARSVLVEIAGRRGIPVRGCASELTYCGEFYGQTSEGSPVPDRISMGGLMKILTGLAPGVTELGCHPGRGSDLETMYGSERDQEVGVLCDPRMPTAIAAMDIE